MSLSFSFASMALRQGEEIVAYSHIPGAFYADISPEIVETKTGGASFAGGARSASAPGEVIITLQERPTWIDQILGQAGSQLAVGVANETDFVQVTGSTITHAAFPLTQRTTKGVEPGEYQIEALAPDRVRIACVTSRGTLVIDDVAADGSTLQIEPMNANIALPNGGLSAGDKGVYRVQGMNGVTTRTTRVRQVQRAQEYQVLVYTSSGERINEIQEYEFPRVLLTQAAVLVAAGRVGSARINGVLLAPNGGVEIYRRRTINQRRA